MVTKSTLPAAFAGSFHLLKRSNMKNFLSIALTIGCLLNTSHSDSAALNANHDSEKSSHNTNIERVIVTADLTGRDLSQLPSTAVVVDSDLIESKQARHLQELLSVVPNLNFSSGASRGKFVQIRGIGERSQFAEPINPSIGLLVDDIDISGIGSLGTLFDLQQVEVLSGPQSVATGFNSLGGIVKLVSNTPTDTPYARLGVSLAQFNESRIEGVYSNAIFENVNARFSAQNTKSDGFVANDFLMRDDTNGIDERSASAIFTYDANENNRFDLRAYYFDIDNGYDAFSLDNNNRTLSDQPGFDRTQANAFSLKHALSINAYELQTTLSYLTADTDYGYDEDWTFTGFHPFAYTSFDRYLRDINRLGIDIKLRGDLFGNDLLLGINRFEHEEDLKREYTFDDDYLSSYEPETTSLYAQYGLELNNKTNMSFAARVEKFKADFMVSDLFIASIDDDLVAFSMALDYSLNNNLLYLSGSRGYKAGGFNIDQRLETEQRSFDPEYNTSLEFGIKGTALEGNGIINLSFFYMDRDDAQVSGFETFKETLDNGTVITSFADAITNADSGVNKGIELSSTWYVTEDVDLQANVGYLDASIGNYELADGSFVPLRAQAQAPKYTVYLGATYRISQDVSLFLDVETKGEYFFSDGHNEKAPFTVIANAQLSYQVGNYTLEAWVKNVFDRLVYTRGFGGFSNDPRDEYAFAEPYFQFGQERQVGISLEYIWE